ncbi:MAG: glycosyltransferase family protein [Pseudomonadota bacterium]
MRILYGVVGEGMGHATRSRVVLDHLLAAGHQIRVMVSGRAHGFLLDVFHGNKNISIHEIHGLAMSYEGNALDLLESVLSNLGKATHGVLWNIAQYSKSAEEGFAPELVVSDFESWAYLYALNHRLPVISIDNMQVINRCLHDDDVTDGKSADFWIARMAVKVKLPGAYHYLVSSFFFPAVHKPRTTLIPPILRPEILAARREPGEHVLVYQTAAANAELVPTLRKLPQQFKVYGMGREGQEGNVTLCAFSQQGFIDDLRTARCVVAGGGYSLMGEAVHLHVPMMSIPIDGQYEQELNARYLKKLGYGTWARSLELDTLAAFIESSDRYSGMLQQYLPRDNGMLFGCVDELLHLAQLDEPKPAKLEADNLGTYDGPPLPAGV